MKYYLQYILFSVLSFSGFHLTVERDWFWFWFWFYYALWLASVFTLVLVLRQSSENRSMTKDALSVASDKEGAYISLAKYNYL